ncbi:MAG: ATP-binding protein [Pseudomonadota bacterium]
MRLHEDLVQVIASLNPWWEAPHAVRPRPPRFRRRQVRTLADRLRQRQPLIQVLRGPRQVGKTTAILQIVEDLLASGVKPADILLLRFDLQILREAGGLLAILRWYESELRRCRLDDDSPAYVFLDEVHKLPRWDQEVKHVSETTRLRMLITGSSSVLVAKGARESLAGRVITTEFPPFLFREVLEAWSPDLVPPIKPLRFRATFSPETAEVFATIHSFATKRTRDRGLDRLLDRYYNRGGYPRLHSGEIDEDVWADYLVETVFERVLGVDIPDLFPIQQPHLLRHLFLSLARRTGQEVSQIDLTEEANATGLRTNQPTVGRYLHYLSDALLLREFRRYPLAKASSARLPLKITLTDLGVRNAIFRGAPSLLESPPDVVGPLVETLVQAVIRDVDLAVHFYRERASPRDRRSPFEEVDFVAERTDGAVLPIEVKFRRRIDETDYHGIRQFIDRYQCDWGIVVTRDTFRPIVDKVMLVPVRDFLLAY